jgi:hypothetical protein
VEHILWEEDLVKEEEKLVELERSTTELRKEER